MELLLKKLKQKFSFLVGILLHVPLLLLAYILQDMIFVKLDIFGVKPLILPLAAVAVGLFEGSTRGGIFGLIAGIVCDASLGEPAVLFTVLLTVCGVAVGLLGEHLLAKGFPSFLLCSAGCILLCTLFQAVSHITPGLASLATLVMTGIIQVIYSLLFTIPIYLPARALFHAAA